MLTWSRNQPRITSTHALRWFGAGFEFQRASDPIREQRMALSPKHWHTSIVMQPQTLTLPPARLTPGKRSSKFNETGSAINKKKNNKKGFLCSAATKSLLSPTSPAHLTRLVLSAFPIDPSAGPSILPARSLGWYPLNHHASKNNPQTLAFSAL